LNTGVTESRVDGSRQYGVACGQGRGGKLFEGLDRPRCSQQNYGHTWVIGHEKPWKSSGEGDEHKRKSLETSEIAIASGVKLAERPKKKTQSL